MVFDTRHRSRRSIPCVAAVAARRARLLGRYGLALAAVGTYLALGTTPAAAGAAGGRATSRDDARLALATSIPIDKNGVTAGYISEETGISTVSTVFEVPTITNCTSGTNSGMGPVVILTGPRYFVGAGAEAECQNGTTSYMVAINHNGTETHPLTVAAEDQISVTITIGKTVVGVRIDDMTSNKRVDQNVPKGKVTAAELGDDSLFQGHDEVPIPRFTDHKFFSTKINGKVLKVAVPLIEDELVLRKTVLIEPGPISASGASFVMKFVHSA
jgi:Peptidase A4 family